MNVLFVFCSCSVSDSRRSVCSFEKMAKRKRLQLTVSHPGQLPWQDSFNGRELVKYIFTRSNVTNSDIFLP